MALERDDPGMNKPAKVLVPVDFSEFSIKAIQHAAEYAKLFGAELILHHVYQQPLYPESMGFHDAPTRSEEEIQRKIEETLASHLPEFAKSGALQSRILVTVGTPYAEIVDAAEREGVGLIVMPTRGRGGLAQFLVGSTAERVVRKAPCPVLVLHGEDFDQ